MMATRSPLTALMASLLLGGSAGAQAVVQTGRPPTPEPAPATAPGAPPTSAQAPAETPAAPAETPPAPRSSDVSVEAAPLASLDLFSPAASNTGLGADLWKGASADLARSVIPTIGRKTLEPGLAGLARRVMATGATAPDGAGADADLAGERALALIALGDIDGARIMLSRTPNVSAHARLSQAAAEAVLWSGDIDKACSVGDSLAEGRDGGFWLRLRAMCLAKQGKASEAQLALDLSSQNGAKDPAAQRLINVVVSGGGNPGEAVADTALGYAASRLLKLDFTPAVAGAAQPALMALAADDEMSVEVRRMAALRLLSTGAEVSDLVRKAFLLPVPDAPPPTAPAPAATRLVKHGRKVVRVAVPSAPKLSATSQLSAQAVEMARLYTIARTAPDAGARNAALLTLLKGAHGPTFKGVAMLAAPEIALATADGQAETDRYLLALAAAVADAPNQQALRDSLREGAISAVSTVDLALLDAVHAVAAADRPTLEALDHLVRSEAAAPAAAPSTGKQRAQSGSLILLALSDGKSPLAPDLRARMAAYRAGPASHVAEILSAGAASDRGAKGEVALLAVSSGGGDALATADRVMLIRILNRVGLGLDARAIALDGLLPLTER